MQSPTQDKAGLAEAFAVADGRAKPPITECDAKLLGFLLRDGECTAEISDTEISVWYSWLRKRRPSTYFMSLAPGVVGHLMQLGGLDCVEVEATFKVGPGTAGTGRYIFDFNENWVRIRREKERVLILVRENRERLDEEVQQEEVE